MDDWEEMEGVKDEDGGGIPRANTLAQLPTSGADADDVVVSNSDIMDVTMAMDRSTTPSPRQGSLSHAATAPVLISNPASGSGRPDVAPGNDPPSPLSGAEGPITPRNDVGPWVFDGSAGSPGEESGHGMGNLNAAVDMDITAHVSDSSSQ